jgi:membrane associated rhomboid family serine protease
MKSKNYFYQIRNYYNKFQNYNSSIKIIIINVFIFFICGFLEKFFLQNPRIYFGLPSSFSFLLWHPWSFFTKAFFHRDLNHILFNSLLLFSTGRLFLNFFDEKSFLKFYFLGILASSLSFLIGMYFLGENKMLYGSSGAIFCLFFAIIAYSPNMRASIPFLGGLEIKYIGLILFFLSFSSWDKGGNFSHLGGALMGFFYMKKFKKGKDIFEVFKKINFFKFFKLNKKKKIDKILDKISKSGYESLSEKEKKALFEK